MDVITIESDAFRQIMNKIQSLDEKFMELRDETAFPLSEKWLDNQDVILLLRISKRTLQGYREQNKIPFSQIGNKIYYKAGDVEKLLKKNYHKIVNY